MQKYDFYSYFSFLSSLQSHLNSGSRVYTNWISLSKGLDCIKKYYDNQEINKVALVKSNTNGIIDSEHIITLDLSTRKSQEKAMPFLINKIDCEHVEQIAYASTMYPSVLNDFKLDYVTSTNKKAMSFNYAISSKEVCIYEYLPKHHIISVIEKLQMDLIYSNLFDYSFFKLDKKEQAEELKRLKNTLTYIIKNTNDPYLLHVFDELYIKNKNLGSLITLTDSREKINYNRTKILKLSRNIPNCQIKK